MNAPRKSWAGVVNLVLGWEPIGKTAESVTPGQQTDSTADTAQAKAAQQVNSTRSLGNVKMGVSR